MKTWSPANTRVPPPFSSTSIVFGATKCPEPITSSAALSV
jgi:hypothetical protein